MEDMQNEQQQVFAEEQENKLEGEIEMDMAVKKVKKNNILDMCIKIFGVLGSLTTAALFINVLFL